jgi:hypothetical protein
MQKWQFWIAKLLDRPTASSLCDPQRQPPNHPQLPTDRERRRDSHAQTGISEQASAMRRLPLLVGVRRY